MTHATDRPPQTPAPHVSPKQVAAYLGCSGNHVRDLMKRGLLAAVREGNRLKTTWGDVTEYLAARRVGPASAD